MKSDWSHPICADCWDAHNLDKPANDAARAGGGPPELCCWCGHVTTSGIYVRADPASTPCHAEHKSTFGLCKFCGVDMVNAAREFFGASMFDKDEPYVSRCDEHGDAIVCPACWFCQGVDATAEATAHAKDRRRVHEQTVLPLLRGLRESRRKAEKAILN